MFQSTSFLETIFIFLITICIAYMFGLYLVRFVDDKINKIQEKSSQQIERFVNQTNEVKKEEKRDEVIVYHKFDVKESPDGKLTFDDITRKLPKDFKFDKDYYESMTNYNKIEGFNGFKEPKQNEVDWEASTKNMNVCFKNHTHVKNGKNTKCLYGVTNYADPGDMSPVDLKIFMLNYPSNFTLQDYVNWLWCFNDKKDQLPYNHLKNLQKLEIGKELKEEKGVLPPPAYYYPPLNAEDYFQKMYNDVNEFQIAESLNSTTGPMLGYNYQDYSEFSQNKDVWGLDGEIRNPDLAYKKTAREVDDYIIPHDSQNLAIEKAFKPYHVKKVEI